MKGHPKRKALRFCSKTYLKSEIEAFKPKLVVAVGKSALTYFAKFTKDERIKGKLERVFLNQSDGIYEGVKLGSVTFSLAVVPHPSGKNRLWNQPPQGTVQTFRRIIEDIKEVMTSHAC